MSRTEGIIPLVLLVLVDVPILITLFLSAQFSAGETLLNIVLCCAIASLVATIAVCLLMLWKRDHYAFVIFQAAFAYWYIIPMIADVWRGQVILDSDWTIFSNPEDIAVSAAAVFVSKVLLTVAYAAFQRKRSSDTAPAVIPSVGLVAVEALIGIVPLFLVSNPLMQLMAGRGGELFVSSNHFSGQTAFLLLFYFLFAALLAAGYCIVASGRWLYAAIFVCGAVTLTVLSGTRTAMLMYLMPAVTLYAITKWNRRAALVSLMIVVGLYFATNAVVRYRVGGNPEAFEDRNLIDNDFFAELMFNRAIIPAEHSFTYESPVFFTVAGLIPRAIWPNRPEAINGDFVMRRRLNVLSAEMQGNILPGILGQYWQTSGWLGIVTIGVWLGLWARLIELRLVGYPLHVKYCMLLFAWAVFISFRGLATQSFLPVLICCGTMWLAKRSKSFVASVVPRYAIVRTK